MNNAPTTMQVVEAIVHAERCYFAFRVVGLLLSLLVPLAAVPIPVALLPACAAPSTAPFAAPAAAPATTLPSTFFALLMIPGDDFDCRDRLPSPFLLAGREPDFLELDRFFAVLLAVVRFFVVFLVGIFPLFNMLTKTCNVDCLAPSPSEGFPLHSRHALPIGS
jgi:hypothetical protein